MLLNIAMGLLFFSEILGFIVGQHQEHEEIRPEDTVTRTLRDDDSLVGTFTVEPISHLDDGVTHAIGLSSKKDSAYADAFNDPEWKMQWYMHDYRKKLGPVMDLNVVPVYRMGYTGKGIHVAIVDEEVQLDHPDLQQNLVQALNKQIKRLYDNTNYKELCNLGKQVKELSFSTEEDKKEEDKSKAVGGAPSYYYMLTHYHGTKSAGVVGMTANNSLCGAGMAYDAKIIAIRYGTGKTSNLVTARSLSHARNKVDIYSNSWGPEDDGKTMEKTNKLISDAIDKGVKTGRGGLGAIYTFPSGNGDGRYFMDDNCGADDLVNHLSTIAISGASADGKRSDYSERCTAIYATTFAGYGKFNTYVTTTSGGGQCTSTFRGTSAAVPQASAIIALVLQANKQLTYRDVMHLIAMGAEVAPLADNDSWHKNGAGFWVSNEFGFGLMNALNMVNWALKWTTVPEKTTCELKFNIEEDTIFRMNVPAIIKQRTKGCQDSTKLKERVFYLEQVMLTTSIDHRYRGAISITLTSAQGTESEILIPRRLDLNRKGLREWNVKSVHNWGENPEGEWKVVVKSNYQQQGLGKIREILYQLYIKPLLLQMPDFSETGRVQAITLWFHGTRDQPEHYKKGPRTYSAFRTANGKTSEPISTKQRTDGGMSSQPLLRSQN